MTLNIKLPSRTDAINEYKRHKGGIAAVFPIHYHRALLRAFNILPVEVWGPPGADPSYGDAHLQLYTCSIVRHGLSFFLAGGLETADMVIVPHCCDSLQGLGSILLDFVKRSKPVFPFYIPRGQRDSDIEFLAREFVMLFERLTKTTGITPSNQDLMDAIDREEAATETLKELFGRRRNLPCTDREFYKLVRSREYLPAELFTNIAQQTLGEAQDTEQGGIPILLSGIVPEPMELFDVLAETGAMVVADDFLSTGRRLYGSSSKTDPFVRMAETIIMGPADSTTGNSFAQRQKHLVQKTRSSGARGVVFYHVKFCEPEQFYLPHLVKSLKEVDIPSVSIEIDIADPLSNQVVTRLEAFMEMLS